jgi:hypothetical protein
MTRLPSARNALLALACSTLFAACGGGGGEDGGSNGIAFVIDPSTVVATATTTDQPFQDFAVLEFYAYGSSCQSMAAGQSVLVTDNTVTYSNGTPSAAHLQRVAQYAEASVRTLRDKFGITPANGVGFDGQKVRVCAAIEGSDNATSGSAGIRTLHVGTPDGYGRIGSLIYHETVHMVQAQALNCQTQQYAWERWFNEGMALRLAGQDLPSKSSLGALQSRAFADAAGGTPFADMDQRAWPRNDRYPGYRLAIDTLLGETGKTEQDLYRFLKQVGDTQGCPGQNLNYPVDAAYAAGWKTAFDATFGTDLRGSGVAGSGFWGRASAYAR